LLGDCQLQHSEVGFAVSLPESRDELADLDDALATAIYRIAQEAVNNALRHAQATRLEVQLSVVALGLKLTVTDNGQGQLAQFQAPGHFGVSGMRERVQALGGSFALAQAEPCGVSVRVTLPMMKKQNNA